MHQKDRPQTARPGDHIAENVRQTEKTGVFSVSRSQSQGKSNNGSKSRTKTELNTYWILIQRKLFFHLKKPISGQAWWPLPVIPATLDGEIRSIVVQGQPRQRVSKTLS
jgi:hypothetical protein